MTGSAVDTVVVGAGQSGLAVSRLLVAARREHVVLERADVGQRWTSQRWDSLRLLTPNWLTRLPGWIHRGSDPDGFMSARELQGQLSAYAAGFGAPVVTGVDVRSLARAGAGYAVRTSHGDWIARHVVLASGSHARAYVPPGLARADVEIMPTTAYRNPGQLPAGGVLVVGASASGVQIAYELASAGRSVVLAVGRHTRMPRSYRGMDVFWWLARTGRLARTIDEVREPGVARREPSLQLVGHSGKGAGLDLDLAALLAAGVRLTGRLVEVTGHVARFADDLVPTAMQGDVVMHRFLDAVDVHVERTGLSREVPPPRRPAPFTPPDGPPRLDLSAEGISIVVVAAGMRPDYTWLGVPVVGDDGYVVQRRGVTPAPGLYVVGQPFQHRRDSTFIAGAGHNAHDVVTHLVTGSTPQRDLHGGRLEAVPRPGSRRTTGARSTSSG